MVEVAQLPPQALVLSFPFPLFHLHLRKVQLAITTGNEYN